MKTTPKTKCWAEYAEYIKVKSCLETTGIPFLGLCVTCGKQYHINFLEAGHLISGRRNSVLFSEKLVNAQCSICNRNFHGQPKKYKKAMSEKYGKFTNGEDKVEHWMARLKRKKIDDKNMDWEGRRERYKRKKGKLLRQHGYKTYKELLQEGGNF